MCANLPAPLGLISTIDLNARIPVDSRLFPRLFEINTWRKDRPQTISAKRDPGKICSRECFVFLLTPSLQDVSKVREVTSNTLTYADRTLWFSSTVPKLTKHKAV